MPVCYPFLHARKVSGPWAWVSVTRTWDREPGPQRPSDTATMKQGRPDGGLGQAEFTAPPAACRPLGAKSSGSHVVLLRAGLHGFGSNSKLLTGGRARRRGSGCRPRGPALPPPHSPGSRSLSGVDAHLRPAPSLGCLPHTPVHTHVYPDPLMGTQAPSGGHRPGAAGQGRRGLTRGTRKRRATSLASPAVGTSLPSRARLWLGTGSGPLGGPSLVRDPSCRCRDAHGN